MGFNSLNILLLGNDYIQQFPLLSYGGIEANVEAIADGLHKRGATFSVIVPKIVQRRLSPYPFEVHEAQEIPTSLGGDRTRFLNSALKIASNIRPDVIWAQSYWSVSIAQHLRIPCICSIHDSCDPIPGWFVDSPLIKYRFFSNFQRLNWARSEREVSRSFVRYHGLRDDEYGEIEHSRTYHLFVGGLSWGYRSKGLDLFVLSALQYPEENFVIYASGNIEIETFLSSCTNGSLRNLFFMGPLERGPKHRLAFERAKSLFMFTRLPEAFGRVNIESLACGTPVYGSRIAALPEIVRVPTDGELFDAGDIPPQINLNRSFDHKKIARDAKRFSVSNEIDTLLSESLSFFDIT